MYRILIAHSDPDVRKYLRLILPWREYGFDTVSEADSFSSALVAAFNLVPNIALISRELDGGRGCDLVSQLCASGLHSTAFCVTSSSCEADLILEALHAGASYFLREPADPEELRHFLSRFTPDKKDLLPEDPVLGGNWDRFSSLTRQILLIARNSLNSSQGVNLLSMGEALHMNSKYLGRIFLRDTGMTLSSYMTACRMEQAFHLISRTEEKISVIASMVGYRHLNRFYVHFRDYFGFSPGTLREGKR